MESEPKRERVAKPTAIDRLIARETKNVESGWTPESFGTLSSEEKAQYFYDLVATVRQARATRDAEGAESMLSQMKSIVDTDPSAARYFSEAFTKARGEQKAVEKSPLFQNVATLASSIRTLSEKYTLLKQRVFTGEIKGVASKKSAEGEIAELSRKIVTEQETRASLVALENVEHVKENTDIAALESYTTLKRYHEEAKEGFAWLPSRMEIHKKILAALKNGRFPLLVGEPGTGKSEQADAVARNLTGESCVKVACTSSTGEQDLIVEKEVEAGTSYLAYGGVTQAFTGYEKSTDTTPSHRHGRIVRLDEFLKINFDKSFGLIKEIGQKKIGELMHRKVDHPILPGSSIIATTNPSGARHHLENMLPALEREFAEIKVDYLSMSHDDPELYEFMLATLMDEKGYVALPKGEIAPAYTEKESVSDEKTADGRKILRTQEIVSDVSDSAHGSLYRLAFAIKSIEDSYTANNPDEKPNYANKLLLIENGAVSPNGQELVLESSTLTLKEVASWMRGFEHRFEETNQAMHTATFSEWIAYKANVFISQSPVQDREKLTAIFDHFGILSPKAETYDKKPMTNIEIGYLSPRVPRPLIVEEVKKPEMVSEKEKDSADFSGRTYETVEYLTTEGKQVRVLAKDTEYTTNGISVALVMNQDVTFFGSEEWENTESGTYVGLTEGENEIAIRIGDLVQVFFTAEFEKKMMEKEMKDFYNQSLREKGIFEDVYTDSCRRPSSLGDLFRAKLSGKSV